MDIGKLLGGILGSAAGAADPVQAPANIIEAAHGLIGMFKVDDTVKAQMNQQLTLENLDIEKTKLASALSLALAQADINKQEAESTSWFIAGWRPAVGWVCVAGLAYDLILAPFLQFGLAAFHWTPKGIPLPSLDSASITALLIPLLGLGALRTTEKIQNAEGNR